MRRKLAAGNWKMNGTQAGLDMLNDLAGNNRSAGCDILICPPAHLLIPAVAKCSGTTVQIGGQTCHPASQGAHTGDISAPMIKDIGASYVIVGHSERRAAYAQSDADVAERALAAQNAGLIAVVCLGETLVEREDGRALEVITAQLEGSMPDSSTGQTLVVAYEPIWAIGTGLIPTMDQIAEVHALLRQKLTEKLGETAQDVRLLYGGSVKAGNAQEIFAVPDVDGALVGGASLKTGDFQPIIDALAQA
ncbi:MAG: triose-phosphate isomerase [Roseobacter sp.]